jgi:hypothetical protein
LFAATARFDATRRGLQSGDGMTVRDALASAPVRTTPAGLGRPARQRTRTFAAIGGYLLISGALVATGLTHLRSETLHVASRLMGPLAQITAEQTDHILGEADEALKRTESILNRLAPITGETNRPRAPKCIIAHDKFLRAMHRANSRPCSLPKSEQEPARSVQLGSQFIDRRRKIMLTFALTNALGGKPLTH